MKKKLMERVEDASSYMTEAELLQEIQVLKNKGAKEIVLELDQFWDNADLKWKYKTLETDSEYEARMKLEEDAKLKVLKAAAERREKDRALYEKLKKEFEP